VQQGRVRAGERVAVLGCGGVGLSAVQVAAASGADVVGVDVDPQALQLARRAGARDVVDATGMDPQQVADAIDGAHLSVDALGSAQTCVASVLSLLPRGRHVQVGLLAPELGRPEIPMERVIALELTLLGSHGMAAHAYPELLALVRSGRVRPGDLVTREISLDDAADALTHPGDVAGNTVVSRL
jgi:alcohol dehydrogenase